MSNTQLVKAAVQQRLAAAAEEIFSLFEQTLRDYEQELFLSKQRIEQQQQQQQTLSRCQGPVQLSVQDVDIPLQQYICEKKTDVGEDDEEPLHVKEEQEDEQWATQADEKQDDADTKETMFNIIYVQRSDEDGRQSPCQSQEVENRGDPLPSSSSEQLRAEPERGLCGASEPTSDCQMSEDSDDEWRDGRPSLSGVKKPQQAEEQIERPYTCSVCNKNFRIKSILTRHMKTHTGEKPYSCSVCGKSFIQRSYLHTHMNSHSGQKPHTCSFCGRGFTQVGNMNAHMRIHTGEKPHSCSDCGKSFREKADLIKHTIIHTGEKPYCCTVCNMRFSAQSNLTRHMKTHSGEKPYSCAACGKRFIRRSHLIIHMKTHTGENS
ncbi:zinc finger protein ZFP2-like [Paralichthys olivaceus]|uniref:zinc finger protein ZFP2-like n=1 Tax=Paralichthys olivaceus TaxID=8255 RepID=UPI00097DF3A1|nr:PREDICTED: histone-lysine N-methyltransferase PRDM9-like [Paralichthys olivaceus]